MSFLRLLPLLVLVTCNTASKRKSLADYPEYLSESKESFEVADDYEWLSNNGKPVFNYIIPGFNISTWPEGIIPFEIDEDFRPYVQQRIRDAIKTLNEDSGCIHLRDRTEDDWSYVKFVATQNLCETQYIGYISSMQEHTIYLSPSCNAKAKIFYGLLQALGLPAEHMRPDRDEHINVHWKNIDNTKWTFFRKYSYLDQRIMKIPYDYESRLHYSNLKFQKWKLDGQSWKPSLSAINDKQRPLGNKLAPTSLDYQKIRGLYCQTGNSVKSTIPAAEFLPRWTDQDMYDTCDCPSRPDFNGECTGFGGFAFKEMWRFCRNATTAAEKDVCKCEDLNIHPCYCIPAPAEDCKSERCPLARCLKQCRYSDKNPSGYYEKIDIDSPDIPL